MAERRDKDRTAAARPQKPGADYLLAVVLAWLVPGAGHWVLGQRARAVVLGFLLLGLFWWGEAGSGGWAVYRKEHPYFWYGQIGNGLSAIIADRFQWGDVSEPPDAPPPKALAKGIQRNIPPFLATGILFTSVSGLLNVLLVLHVMDPRTWERRAARLAGEEKKP